MILFRGRMFLKFKVLFLVMMVMLIVSCQKKEATGIVSSSPYGKWINGPPTTPSWFPIGVWAQNPRVAGKYKNAGINVYVGLHGGPTEKQLAGLRAAGMLTICHFNPVAKRYMDDTLIIGWMHGDEPDNAHSIAEGWEKEMKGKKFELFIDGKYHFSTLFASIHPRRIKRDYFLLKTIDPTRPVYLNLGVGVSYEKAHGRGFRSGHLEDYPEYIKGCDIPSFDIYPVNSAEGRLGGKLEYVPRGIDRLRKWSDYKKPVWCWIECTKIGRAGRKPTVSEVRSEIWMALIHGAGGVGYFCHSFVEPTKSDMALLKDKEMLAGVTEINKQITELAPVLNNPTVEKGATATSSNSKVPVDIMVKKDRKATYLFAVGMRKGKTEGSFLVKGLPKKATAEVLGEDRTIKITGGKFKDTFGPYQVHLYKIK
jgi:hypothetical protein